MNNPTARLFSRWLPLAAALAAMLGATACLNGEESYARKAADGAFEQMYGRSVERGQVAHSDADATRGAQSLPLPEDFPGDVALPERYAVESVLELGSVSSITLTVPDQPATLFTATRDGMRKAGWEQTISLQQSADYAVLGWRKDARETSFTFVGNSSGTTMSVQLLDSRLH